MSFIAEIAISALLVIGGVFGLIGSFGLVKLPDQMTRLHAPGNVTTLGVVSVLVASIVWFSTFGDHSSWHELLIVLFLFLTSPITGLMIAKAHMHLSWEADELPDAGEDENWATYGDSAEMSLLDDSDSRGTERDLRE